jgi:hypothetical protein
LQIVASADIGEFGPTDGRPVRYRFHSLYHIQGVIPWLLLPLAFIALRENRTAQAAWILAPIALLAIVYWAVTSILRLDSGGTVQLNVLFTVMVAGFSMVWLLAERIGNRKRFVTFTLATLVYFGFLGVNLLCSGFGKDIVSITLLAAVSIPPIMIALLIAARSSSKSFSRARFTACTGAGLFGSLLAIALAILFLFYPDPNRPIGSRIAEVLAFSFLTSLIYFVGLLPFLALLFTNPFWRKRFEYVTGIRTSVQ